MLEKYCNKYGIMLSLIKEICRESLIHYIFGLMEYLSL